MSPIRLVSASEIESSITEFVHWPNSGLIVSAGPQSVDARDLIIALAARKKLPTVYTDRSFAEAGGLISYGPNFANETRRFAIYMDRILQGEKPASLPIQTPKEYELVINMKTARALGLNMPPSVINRADAVIE